MTRDLSGLARRSHRDACRDNGAKAQSKKPMGYPTPRFAILDLWPRSYSQASQLLSTPKVAATRMIPVQKERWMTMRMRKVGPHEMESAQVGFEQCLYLFSESDTGAIVGGRRRMYNIAFVIHVITDTHNYVLQVGLDDFHTIHTTSHSSRLPSMSRSRLRT